MSNAYTGGCACGEVRYEIDVEPVFSNHCQCRDCQRRSGAGHGSFMTFPRQGVALFGDAKGWNVAADNGNVKTCAFCATCGSPVYITFSYAPEFIAIHVGSLDDPGRFVPQAVTFGSRGHAWDYVDPALRKFDGMPTS